MKKKNKYNAKLKTCDGIEFKSLLEVYCYKALKARGIPLAYEKYSFEISPGFIFNSYCYENFKTLSPKTKQSIRPITYCPDFVDESNDRNGWVIEVKGHKTEAFTLRWKLFKRLLKEQKINKVLYMPRNQKEILFCVEQISKAYEQKN